MHRLVKCLWTPLLLAAACTAQNLVSMEECARGNGVPGFKNFTIYPCDSDPCVITRGETYNVTFFAEATTKANVVMLSTSVHQQSNATLVQPGCRRYNLSRTLHLPASLATQVGGVLDHPAMRPDPVMDLVMLVAIMLGAIVLFLLLWLLVRKYGAAPIVEPPRAEETLVDGASAHRRASKTSSQQRLPVDAGADRPRGAVPSSAPERGLPDAARGTSAEIGRAVQPGLSSGPDVAPHPGAECSGTTDFPTTHDKRLKKDGAKAAVAASVAKHARDAAAGAKRRESSRPESRDSTVVQNKPKASSGWILAVEGCKDLELKAGKESAEDADAAATGTVGIGDCAGKRPSCDEEQDTGIGRTSGGQVADQTAHEEHSGMASAEQTTTKEHRRHKKKSKKQQREGSGRGSCKHREPT
ncbi:hypothetical protein HPB49_015806 [Dermacentor silvarum]|uniref:Uncharacterized protein n=1 Tax=Dermacentor silvarum TaxID=543639 RepID=A0ACB8DJS4_DERSI|nr:hypothetical protein HPB49_015806 [Dermacentor silvarum]